jgi:outer membrane protein
MLVDVERRAEPPVPPYRHWWDRHLACRGLLAIFLFAFAVASRAQNVLTLTLADAQKLALQNNPQVAVSRYSADAAAQIPAEVGSAFQPTVFGSVSGTGADSGSRIAAGVLNSPVLYNHAGTGLTVNQLITDFGRTGSLVQSARLRAQAQEQTYQTTRAQVLLQTDRAYYNVLRAQSVLKVAEQTVSARQLVSDQVTTLQQSNLKSLLDVSFANVNLADAKLLLASAQNDIASAFAELATAIGLPAQTQFTLNEEPSPGVLSADVSPFIGEAIQKRPELSDLRLQLQAAESFEKAERDLWFPTIGVTGTAGFAPAGDPQIASRYGAIGLNVNVPVFNGGLFKARRSEAELRARAAAQSVKDLENRVIRDVRVAYLNAQTAFQRIGLTAQLLDQAAKALDLAQSRFDLGLSSIIELSQAQLNLTSAQIAGASAKYDYQIQRALLDYQVGVLR